MSIAVSAPEVWWQRWAGALGFHVPLLAFALRTGIAAFAALAVAQALGLEHPHWAAMSAWASSQPTREHLLSRSGYRLGGSVVGVAYAVVLVLLAQDAVWVLALGLALWGALCAFWGNLQRGFMVYGCMLAGYSAAMVVLLHHGPANTIWPFAGDRMLTVMVGVLAALGVSWCFAPRRQTAVLVARSHQALAEVLQSAVAHLRRPAWQVHSVPVQDQARLLSQLAQVEELLELYPEGSRTARHTSHAMHWQLHGALELVYQMAACEKAWCTSGNPGVDSADQSGWTAQTAVADALVPLVQALQATPHSAQNHRVLVRTLRHAAATCAVAAKRLVPEAAASTYPVLQALCGLLQAMRQGLRAQARDLQHLAPQRRSRPRLERVPLHRDWVGARQAAVRAGACLLVVGMLWAWTGSRIVGFAMLGLATMLLVFSAMESPGRTMAFVLRGQLIGAGLALACQILVWPMAQSSWQMVWMVLPFALLAGLVFAHQRTAAGALDTNMAMFILLAPAFPMTASLSRQVSYALAVVSGPALAWVLYRWIYPTDAHGRMQTLVRVMVDEVPALARRLLEEKNSAQARLPGATWYAQLHHRLLRLVRWADKTRGGEREMLPPMGLSLRAMQTTMLLLQQWRRTNSLATPALRRTERLVVLALQRTAQWGEAAPSSVRSYKVQAVWRQLAQHSALPADLAAQAGWVAQRDLPCLDRARQAWH